MSFGAVADVRADVGRDRRSPRRPRSERRRRRATASRRCRRRPACHPVSTTDTLMPRPATRRCGCAPGPGPCPAAAPARWPGTSSRCRCGVTWTTWSGWPTSRPKVSSISVQQRLEVVGLPSLRRGQLVAHQSAERPARRDPRRRRCPCAPRRRGQQLAGVLVTADQPARVREVERLLVVEVERDAADTARAARSGVLDAAAAGTRRSPRRAGRPRGLAPGPGDRPHRGPPGKRPADDLEECAARGTGESVMDDPPRVRTRMRGARDDRR